MIKFKDAKEQWKKLLPFIYKIRTSYTKDENLIKQIDVLVNRAEPALAANEIVSEHVAVLHGVLSSEYYYRNRQDIRQDEEDHLKEFFIHLDLFYKLAMKEERVRDEESEEKKEKERIPNLDESPDLYEKDEKYKGRIL